MSDFVTINDDTGTFVHIDKIEGVIPCDADDNAPHAKCLVITDGAKFIGTLTPKEIMGRIQTVRSLRIN